MNADLGTQHWPVTTAAAGVQLADGSQFTEGPIDHVFALASLTKPLFAYALLVAVEEGSIALEDEPLDAGAPSGASVRHLLAHASGLGPQHGDPTSGVGERRTYSNLGFEVLGRHLEDATGMPTADYLRLGVTEPLAMHATRLDGSPAHGATSTVGDWLRFLSELQAPALLAAQTLAEATTVQYGGLDGVLPGYGRQQPNDWGLGFELKVAKAPHWTAPINAPTTFGHFGRAGTMFWIDPHTGVGAVALADREFGAWARSAWPPFSERALALAT